MLLEVSYFRGKVGLCSVHQLWFRIIHSHFLFLSFAYSCQEGETKELWSSGHHLKSCRAVVFSEDGQSKHQDWGRQPACGRGQRTTSST
jgi:hypothetical protein